jgi:glycine betaine catabolism B
MTYKELKLIVGTCVYNWWFIQYKVRMPAKEFNLLFVKKEKLAENTYSFYFSKEGFDFLPGQYIRMVLPHDADERGTSRFFTISSSPYEKDFLIITAKVIKSTFKNKLLSLETGKPVKIFGPLGTLILNDDEKDQLIFLSGGMGITPFHSMITYAAAKKLPVSLTLLASFSQSEEMIFYEELMESSHENKNITVVYINKRVSEETLRKYTNNLDKSKYFIVGPPAMVEATRELLEMLNIDEEKILTESFTGY